MSILRVRFEANIDDPRPINWPIKYPYWITGYGDDCATIVAYADDLNYIYSNWPEAEEVVAEIENRIEYTDRFPKPAWIEDGEG